MDKQEEAKKMIAILITAGGVCLLFGVVYPVVSIAIHKLCGSKKSIREIWREL